MAYAGPTRNAPVEMRYDPGVVDQGIDLVEAVDGFMHEPAHVFFIAHIRRNRDGFDIEIPNFAKRFVHPFEIGICENNFCSCFCERVRGVTANPFGATRDDHDFTLHEGLRMNLSLSFFLPLQFSFLLPVSVSASPRATMPQCHPEAQPKDLVRLVARKTRFFAFGSE